MRQSMKLGLPKLTEELGNKTLKPFTAEECRQCWETPNPEFDGLDSFMARRERKPPELE